MQLACTQPVSAFCRELGLQLHRTLYSSGALLFLCSVLLLPLMLRRSAHTKPRLAACLAAFAIRGRLRTVAISVFTGSAAEQALLLRLQLLGDPEYLRLIRRYLDADVDTLLRLAGLPLVGHMRVVLLSAAFFNGLSCLLLVGCANFILRYLATVAWAVEAAVEEVEPQDLAERQPPGEQFGSARAARYATGELFALCDTEAKGFIVRSDMRRLCDLLPLTADEVDGVFDKLDGDGNGQLTLDEFTSGFGAFVGISAGSYASAGGPEGASHQQQHCHGGANCDEYCLDEDEHFQKTVNKLIESGIFQDEDSLREMWSRLQTEQPDLLPCLECLLVKMTDEIAKSQASYRTLEKAMRTVQCLAQVQKLFQKNDGSRGGDEAPVRGNGGQVRAERMQVLAEQRAREKQLRLEMEREIREKEKLCHELMSNHEALEKRLAVLNQARSESAQENERLAKERDSLEVELAESREALDDSRSYIDELQRKLKEDRRRRAVSAMRLTEGIALERRAWSIEDLREANRRLKDQSDIAGGVDGRGKGFDEIVHFREDGDERRGFNRQELLQSLLASAAVV
uniref:EF-hand domain-containing protein n=1 Tax=Macrostomum lignano TaxID=282301 RepID=A0A1I8JQB5_9PLAT